MKDREKEGEKAKPKFHSLSQNDEINYEIVSIVTVIAFASQIFVSLERNLTVLLQKHL